MTQHCPAHLVYVSCDTPGIQRKRWGRGFIYLDPRAQKIQCTKTLARIERLVIPPAWADVWICTENNGHLQAAGYDERKRRQYRYHDDWITYRQNSKFRALTDFAEQLPQIRQAVWQDLQSSDQEKQLLATVVWLLDRHLLRVGNEAYSRDNGSYGATTLRRKHVNAADDGTLSLEYTAKSGRPRRIQLNSPVMVKRIKQLSELPGYELFRYQHKGKAVHIDSQGVNDYLQSLLQSEHEHISARTFRTWGGTVQAVRQFPAAVADLEAHPRRQLEPTLVKRVARCLNNTVSVCREYYIHPDILSWLTTDSDVQELSASVPDQTNITRYHTDPSQVELDPLEQLVLSRLQTEA